VVGLDDRGAGEFGYADGFVERGFVPAANLKGNQAAMCMFSMRIAPCGSTWVTFEGLPFPTAALRGLHAHVDANRPEVLNGSDMSGNVGP
jgi:hypothetical protein